MNVYVADDLDIVRNILVDPDVWERAAEPGISPDAFYPIMDSLSVWLLVEDEGEAIGTILVTYETSASVRIHPYMLKAFHHRGRDMMKSFYEWFLKSMQSSIVKVNVTIPMTDRKLYNFAKKTGFVDEGVNRHSYRRDDSVYDQWNLGITKHEIERAL